MKKQIHTRKEVRKMEADRLKATVLELLRWNELKFGEYQYEQGMAYLKAYLLNDEYGIGVMERSRTFWNWWKNQWTNFDEGFAANAKHLDRTIREQVYFEMHDGRMLSGKIRPHKVVLEESHSIIVNDLIGTAI